VRAAGGAAGGQARGAELSAAPGRVRFRITCRGVVQGVGFRPSVFRLASALELGGWVCNTPDGVVIEVEGVEAAAGRFISGLRRSLPPLARIDDIDVREIRPVSETDFRVVASAEGRRQRALVPPDTALCADCRAEMESRHDRRRAYPFTTCTNCGPRFSIVHGLPYDRERTAMSCFPLCPECEREYADPRDRRFHAEPVCCPECGPRLWLQDVDGMVADRSDESLRLVRRNLAAGAIVAVKALGGFQLACRADDPRAVARLRERKRRPTKPFAVMVRDLDIAGRLVSLTSTAAAVLASPQAPVVLAPRRAGAAVAPGVAPGLSDLGVMLPTAPLHVELFRGAAFDALVMTSGNGSDEPICRSNREALARLAGIADLFLLHDRDVVRRVDDSVVRAVAGATVMVRRARGFVPGTLPLPVEAVEPVLALGPYLQATACLAVGREAFPSQHVGVLDTDAARAFLAEVVSGLEEFLETEASVVVVDAHPDYPSTWLGERLARQRGARLLRVQHHVAHAAATLAEHGAFPAPGETAVALSLDGTGWGPDGVAWGGEWLSLDGELRWRRLAHLEPLPLVGGAAAVREPWRVLAAALARHGMGGLLGRLPVAGSVSEGRMNEIARLSAGPSWPLATGAGRVFEAAGAMLGLASSNGYEGEAAARLESVAAAWSGAAPPWREVELAAPADGLPVLPSSALLAAAARRVVAGECAEAVAAGFHATFAAVAVEITRRVAPAGAGAVALGGGCMVNRLLRDGLARGLDGAGKRALLPTVVPPGDGGIAYGQAVLGAVAVARSVEPSEGGA
jgi:hydrogenase maturation protein HypF